MSEQFGPDDSWSKRRTDPMLIVVIVSGVALLLFAVSVIPVILDEDDRSDVASATLPTVDSVPSPTTEPGAASASATLPEEGAPPVSVASRPPTVPTTAPAAPAATVPATDAVDARAPTTVASAGPTTPPPSTAPPTTAPPTTAPATAAPPSSAPPTTAVGSVPESRAVVQGGKIYLEGAVPTEEAREEIVALAGEILGPDNVIDGYFVDPRASDPNLGQIRVADAVLFERGSATIAPDFEPLLNQGLALLTIRPSASFVIFGHTDSDGSEEYNQGLSEDRAQAVVTWYVERGIDPTRLSGIGRGELEPIAPNDTAEGRQQNRRIEVQIENLLVD